MYRENLLSKLKQKAIEQPVSRSRNLILNKPQPASIRQSNTIIGGATEQNPQSGLKQVEIKQEPIDQLSNVKTTSTDIKVEDENIYVNIQVYNPIDNQDELGQFGITCASNITQSSPIIDDPSQYRICCERFTIPASLPIFIYPSEEVATELYQVEVIDTETGTYDIQPLIYIDWATSLGQYPRGIYYYQHLLTFVNNAIQVAYNNCALDPNFPIDPENAIRMIFEPQTELFYLEVPTDHQLYFSGRIQLRFSLALYLNFFSTFPAQYYEDPVDLPLNFVFTPNRSTVSASIFKQYNETPCISVWNTVAKLLILSNTIPVNNEIISSSNQKSQAVLMDFEPTAGVASSLAYQYFAITHRWYDMIGTTPLNQLQIEVNVVYKDGSTFPLLIQRGEFFSMKLLIRPKESNVTN